MNSITKYRPSIGFKSGHAQSVVAGLRLRSWIIKKRGSVMLRHAYPKIVGNKQHGLLLAMVSKQVNKKTINKHHLDTVVLLHGWEGSHESVYLLSLADTLYRAGYNVVRLNLRDHGETYHLNEKPFHAARVDEIAVAIKQIRALLNPRKLFLAGFSMGGNYALRTALLNDKYQLGLNQVVSISPVVDPVKTTDVINKENGYRRYFIKNWHNSIKRKQQEFQHLYNFDDAFKHSRLDDLVEYFVKEGVLPFKHKNEYLTAYGITNDQLSQLSVPCSIFTAEDDPVIPVEDFYNFTEHENLQIHISKHGGHCGFVDGIKLNSVLEPVVLDIFSHSK